MLVYKKIIHEELNKKKIIYHCVPHNLTEYLKMKSVSTEIIKLLKDGIHRII